MIFGNFKFGKVYAVLKGDIEGQMLCYIKQSGDKIAFLAMPSMENHWIPKKDFDIGLEEGILEYIEKLPSYVKKVAKAQFEQNEKDSSK